MNSYDHYSEATELANILRKEGLDYYADALVEAMREGATGTEIFMAMRWNIKSILDDKKCSGVAEAKAWRLYQELDKALQ